MNRLNFTGIDCEREVLEACKLRAHVINYFHKKGKIAVSQKLFHQFPKSTH